MLNYIKFAIFQIFGFLLSIPELIKLKYNEKKYSSIEKFRFVKNHAKRSLDLVKIKIKVIGKEKVPKEEFFITIGTIGHFALYAIFKDPGLKSEIKASGSFTQVRSPSGNVEVEYLDPIYDHIENPKIKTAELAERIKEKMICAMEMNMN